ncbi:MAG: HEAT repeat domain-containing protein [Deltaproteobacteria bacterium]|nr:HEAT repeat domain-containing protein [Deltaproteobacteria bacterium]
MTMRGSSKLVRGVLTAALVGALAGGAVAAPKPKIEETTQLKALSASIDALKSDDLTLRNMALQALQKSRPKEALPHVLLLLRVSDADVRGYAAAVLGALGDPTAAEYLLTAARTARFTWELADEIKALGRVGKGNPKVLTALRATLDDTRSPEVVRAATFDALGRLEEADALQDVVDLVATDRDRRALGTALLDRGDQRGVRMLVDALASEDDDVGTQAMDDLATRAPKLASKLLAAMVRDDEVPEAGRDRASAVLGAYGAAHVAGVLPALASRSSTVRTAAAAALAAAPLPKAKAALKKLMADGDRFPTIMGALALAQLGDKGGQKPLGEMMTQGGLSDVATRWLVVTLALVGDQAYVDKLSEFVRAERLPYASMQLPKAAKLIVPLLAKQLDPALIGSGPDVDWLLSTLVRAPDKKAVLAALQSALTSDKLRMSALMAIVRMGDPDAAALAGAHLEDKNPRIAMAAGIAVMSASATPLPKKVFWY